MANTIKHPGIVENIEGTHLQVRIVQTSACDVCRAKGHCVTADAQEKLIDVFDAEASSYQPGESVWVTAHWSMGGRAVLLAFVIPFLLILFSLFLWMGMWGDELGASLCSLAILVLYYLFLYFRRGRLQRQFSFSIEPRSEICEESMIN